MSLWSYQHEPPWERIIILLEKLKLQFEIQIISTGKKFIIKKSDKVLSFLKRQSRKNAFSSEIILSNHYKEILSTDIKKKCHGKIFFLVPFLLHHVISLLMNFSVRYIYDQQAGQTSSSIYDVPEHKCSVVHCLYFINEIQ